MRLRAKAADQGRAPSTRAISGGLILGTALMAGCSATRAADAPPSVPVVIIQGRGFSTRKVESQEEVCREPKAPGPGERIPACAIEKVFVEGDGVEFTTDVRRRLHQIQKMYAKSDVRIEPSVQGQHIEGYWVALERYGADDEVLDGDWISYVETGVNIHYVAQMNIEVPGHAGLIPSSPTLQLRLYEFQSSNPELSLLLRFDNNNLSSMGIAPLYSLEPDPKLKAWIDYVRTGIQPPANP